MIAQKQKSKIDNLNVALYTDQSERLFMTSSKKIINVFFIIHQLQESMPMNIISYFDLQGH